MRFNIALLPPDGLAKDSVAYAQDKFFFQSDGYCLSDNVFPHVTLAQFEADRDSVVQKIFSKVLSFPLPEAIHLNGLNIREGVGGHRDFEWIEILLAPDGILFQLHREVVDLLLGEGLELLGAVLDQYHPHLTLARLSTGVSDTIEFSEAAWMRQANVSRWPLSVGCSDENGQYLKTVHSS